jgi:hypothetical protein
MRKGCWFYFNRLVYKLMAQKVVAQTKALIAAKLHTFSGITLKWLLLRPACSLAITFLQRASMGGLFVATLLTLLVVPSLYAIWFRVGSNEPLDVSVEPRRLTDRLEFAFMLFSVRSSLRGVRLTTFKAGRSSTPQLSH